MFSCIGNNSYATSITPLKTNVLLVESIPISQTDGVDDFRMDCIRDFYMPCPEGSHGEGYYFRQYLDCSTGEVTGIATRGAGCVNDEDVPAEP